VVAGTGKAEGQWPEGKVSSSFVAAVRRTGGNVVLSSEIRGLSISETANDKYFTETTLIRYGFEILHQGEAKGLKMHRKAVF
jgi:hypothetical protein